MFFVFGLSFAAADVVTAVDMAVLALAFGVGVTTATPLIPSAYGGGE